nr:hypothetical protein [Tanacetum cinerariifolium]
MRRLEATGTYNDDKINRLARGGTPAHESTLNSLHKKVDYMMSLFKSDSKYSDMFSQFESGGASGSGGYGDEEEGADHQDDEDEDGDGDTGRAQPLRSTRRLLTPSSWHTLLTGNSFGMRTDEMRRLEATGTYTDDEINRLARGGKQLGHIPGVGRVLPARAIASPSTPAHESTPNSLHKKVDFMMSLLKSDSKYSDMFSQFESGGASGSGGCRDDEVGADDQDDEDENGDGDTSFPDDMSLGNMCHRDTNFLTGKYVGPTVSLGKESFASVPYRTFPGDKSPGKDLIMRLERARTLERHSGCVSRLSFNDGDILVSGSDDRDVILWDWEIGCVKLSFNSRHRHKVLEAKIMPETDDRSIVTCGADGQVRHATILECGTVETKLLARHYGTAHKIANVPDSPHVFYTCGEDGLVQHFDLRTRKPTKLFTCQPECALSTWLVINLIAIAIDPRNPNLFVVGGSDTLTRLYDNRNYRHNASAAFGKPADYFFPKHLLVSGVGITGLAFSDQSELLVSYSKDSIYRFSKDMGWGDESQVLYHYQLCVDSDAETETKQDPLLFKGHRNYAIVKGVGFFGPKCEYVNYSTAKELWNALVECYFTKDATSKKFIVSKFNSYTMVDSRPIMDQMYELQHILNMFTQNNMNMDESIQVASIIDKLPSTWKDVKKNLKHRKDDLSLKVLGKHLLIEEQYRLKNKTNDDTSKVHVVEEKGESSKAGGKKRRHDDKDKKKSKKNKKDVICCNCKKPGHFKRECRALKKKQDRGNDNKRKDNNFVSIISKAFSLEE